MLPSLGSSQSWAGCTLSQRGGKSPSGPRSTKDEDSTLVLKMTSLMTLTHCLLSPNLGFSCCKMNMLTWGYISSETPKSTLVLQYLLTLAISTVVLEVLGLWKFPQTTALLYKWGQKAFHSQPYVCCLYFSCDTNFLFFSISGLEAALFPINPFP